MEAAGNATSYLPYLKNAKESNSRPFHHLCLPSPLTAASYFISITSSESLLEAVLHLDSGLPVAFIIGFCESSHSKLLFPLMW